MSRSRRRIPCSLVACLTLAAPVACSKRDPGPPDGSASSLLLPDQAQRVLARVGDKTITLGDFAAALEHMDEFDRMRYQSPERRKELLDEMINVQLLADEAVARGWDKDPLAQHEMREVLRDAFLADARKDLPQPSEIPEGEVRAYFDAHKAEFREPERRRVSVIVVNTQPQAAEALESAQKTNTVAGWGELVRSRSAEPSARANVPIDLAGDMGFVTPPSSGPNENPRVPEEIRKAAYEIEKVGDVLPRIVKAKNRLWLVRLAAKTEAHEATFGEAERRIRVRIVQDRARAKERELIDKLRETHKVHVDEAALAGVKVPPTQPPK